ncbi:DMT family transporter [Pseudodesulfovibrio profundus]|nr:DMT family transporter [Pseudodesulfovibrio profundus]|tara:strand:+ start:56 stop:553 length:498 start_codon:yes stop_codon:yes gene_type:complete
MYRNYYPWTNRVKPDIVAPMKWLFILLGLLAGATMPLQAGLNLRLRHALDDPIWAALISFAVGTAALAFYCFASRPLPTAAMAASAPWWAWLGGFLGAFFVSMTIVLAANLGATATMALLLAGQFTAALLLDHYGLVGFDIHAISWQRLVGVGLLIAGALMVNRY